MFNAVGSARGPLSPGLDHQRKATTENFSDAMSAVLRTQEKPAPDGHASYNAIAKSYDDWSAQRRADGASKEYMDRVDDARQTYLSVVSRAANTGGFEDPVAFLKTLTSAELRAIQTTQSLANDINPSTVSAEGAYNLLMPRTMARDLDGDGKCMVGIAQTIVFPPSDAPPQVKEAWKKTTSAMDFGMQLHMQMSMYGAGQADIIHDEGSSTVANYGALVGRAVTGAEFNLGLVAPEHKQFAEKLLEALRLFQTNLDAARA